MSSHLTGAPSSSPGRAADWPAPTGVPIALETRDSQQTRRGLLVVLVITACVPWLKIGFGGPELAMFVVTGVLSFVAIASVDRSVRSRVFGSVSRRPLIVAGAMLTLVGALLAQVFSAEPYYELNHLTVGISRLLLALGVASIVVAARRRGDARHVLRAILPTTIAVFVVVVIAYPLVTSGHNFLSAAADGLRSGSADAITRGSFGPSFEALEPVFTLPRVSSNLRYPMLLMVALGIGFRDRLESWSDRLLVVGGVAIVAVGFSRAAIVALALAAMLAALPQPARTKRTRRNRWVVPSVLTGSAVAVLALAAPGPLSAVVDRAVGRDNRSYTVRSSAITSAFDVFDRSRLGLDRATTEVRSPHVAILDGLYGAGLLGMLGMTMVVVGILLLGRRVLRTGEADMEPWVRRGLLFALSVLLVRAFTAGSLIFDAPAWFAFGLILALAPRPDWVGGAPAGPPRRMS